MASTKKIRKLKKYRLSENQQIRHLINELSTKHYMMFAEACYECNCASGRRTASKMMKRYRRANQK